MKISSRVILTLVIEVNVIFREPNVLQDYVVLSEDGVYMGNDFTAWLAISHKEDLF